MTDEPLSVFISYSHEDEELRKQLDAHLSPLRRRGVLSVWTDHEITPGEEWNGAIAEALESARIILLLVSADFFASDFCYEKELERALEKHTNGESCVVPVILRPCRWQREEFAKLQAIPKGAKPVTEWDSQDNAFLSIVEGIEKVAKKLGHP